MRKKWLLLFLLFPALVHAQYQIKIKATNTADSIAYFRGTVFDDKNYIPKDTIKLYKGNYTVAAKKPIIGGIYFLYFPKSKQKVFFALENLDSIKIEIRGTNYLDSTKFSNKANQQFIEYQLLENKLSNYDTMYAAELAKGKKFNLAQKAAFFQPKTSQLISYRTTLLKNLKQVNALFLHLNTLNILDSSVPSRKNYNGRNELIKRIDFKNPKLLFTPNIKNVLNEYYSYYPLQADSLNKGLDTVMNKVDGKSNMSMYITDYFIKLLHNREIVNNTEAYTYYLEKYILNQKYKISDIKQLGQLKSELANLKSLQLQDTCVNMILKDTAGQLQNLQEFASQNKFTLIIFYDPTCEHCKVELPKMDSTINLLENTYNIKVGRYAVCNEPNLPVSIWKDFIVKYNLSKNYINVNLGNNMDLRKSYDAFTNPIFYLVNNKGILLGKKLSPQTVRNLILANYLK
jgi:thiol-disulfide isomerase/thioredoxin